MVGVLIDSHVVEFCGSVWIADAVHEFDGLFGRVAGLAGNRKRGIDVLGVLRHLRRLKEQGRIRRRVARLKLCDGGNIARVGNHGCELLK